MDQVDQIREKTDIVALLSEYLELKQAGRNFKTTCPFHHEKSPSFVVSPERQIWHCFGCNKGGDVFTFLMEYEQMEFPEALRFLAKKAGIELKSSERSNIVTTKKEILYGLNYLAAEFYHYLLTKHKIGKEALSYLTNTRNLNPKIIETFKLGFAPSSGNALTRFLLGKKGYSEIDLIEAGLAYRRGRDVYDFFFGRLMFPLIDARDNIVGFSARGLTNESMPKYLNTRDTLIYNKSNQLFGINIAKKEIKSKNQAILVEGEFDVLSLFQHGIGNVVGIKGTALTESQLILLKRFCSKITLSLDKDSAGQQAMLRSIPLIEKQELLASVVVFDNAKDPDEAVRTDEYQVKDALKHDEDIYEYLLNQAIQKYDVKTPQGKSAITKMVLPLFAGIRNEIVKEHFVRKLGEALNTSYESINREMAKYKKEEKSIPSNAKVVAKRKREELLEEYIFSLLVQGNNPSQLFIRLEPILMGYEFSIASHSRFYSLLNEYFTKTKYVDLKLFVNTLPEEMKQLFDICYIAPLPTFQSDILYENECLNKAMELKKLFLRQQISMSKDSDLLDKLQQEYIQIDKELKSKYSRLASN